MEKNSEKLAEMIEIGILIGSILVIGAWALGMPFFYATNAPVMSIFTAISLFIIVSLRLATKHLHLWPITGNIALLMIVGGGNLSSILMLISAPGVHIDTKSPIVMTSIFTSIGFVLFSIYEILLYLRKTPKSIWILDDLLIHLALVPGELSLIGHLFDNPTYLSMSLDPRVGVSILEMCFMAALVSSTVLANKNLFLWQFLKGGTGNQMIFAALFANQYIAPLLYLFLAGKDWEAQPYGPELFILLGGVFATLGFLLFQAFNQNKTTAS